MPDEIITREHHGHTITLRAEDLRFYVEGPLYDDAQERYKVFDSLVDARSDITKRTDERHKEEAQNVTLNARVLSEEGDEFLVTKISRTNGNLVGPKSRYVYPALPIVADALKRQGILRKQLDIIEEFVRLLRINSSRAFSRIELESYPLRCKQFQDEVNEKRQKAMALKPVEVEEQESFDNLTEGLQASERGQRMEEVAGSLEEQASTIEEVESELEQCKE